MSAERLYAPVDGIYCDHCVETITRALASLDGVTRVSVRQNTACIEGEHLPSPAAITAPEASLNDMAKVFSGWGGPTE